MFRKLFPLAMTQFLGVFNDHAYRTIAVFAAIGLSGDYSKNAAFIALITVIYALPFIVFPTPAGYFSDKFAKRNVIVVAKIAELLIMLGGLACLANFASWGIKPLMLVMFLMSAQSCFFSPSFNGILPELFTEKQISKVNGIVGMVTMLAVLLGMGSGILVKSLAGGKLHLCGIFVVAVSALGVLASLKVVPGRAASPGKEWTWLWFSEYFRGLRGIISQRALFLSVLGDSYFAGMGIAFQSVLLVYGKFSLGLAKDHESGILLFTTAAGIAAGCLAAGKISGKKVELGLVPYGAVGMTVFLLMCLFPGPPASLMGISFYPLLMLFLVMLGISAGLFIVPLRSYVQQKSDPAIRGSVIANANVISFVSIAFSGLFFFYMTSGAPPAEAATFTGIERLRLYCHVAKPESLIILISALTVAASAYACRLLPDFMVRCAIVALTNVVYRIRSEGEENIPERGPALIVSNHISFVDGLLISACSSRIVRFMMHQDYYRNPLFHYFVKWMGFIEVPDGHRTGQVRTMFDKAKEALRRGEVLCIFPEGKLTRNGVMSEFKKGFSRVIPEDMDVPLIPVRLGMIWGSIFSYYYGRIKLRMPRELPHPASITVGKPVPKDVTPFQLRQLISELGAEAESAPRREERPLHYQFAKIAARHPFRKTVFEHGRPEGISNFALWYKSILLSREIRRLDNSATGYVGVLMPNCIAATAATLAVLNADKVPAMLNYTVPKETMRAAIGKAGIRLVLTSRMFLKKAKIEEMPEMVCLEDLAKAIPDVNKLIYAVLCAVLPHQEVMNIVAPLSHRDVGGTAVVIFSSGSTGSPKGVMLSHRNINSNIYSFLRVVGWRPREDRLLGNLPLFHSFGFTTSFWLPLMSDTEVAYTPNPLDMSAAGEAIEKFGLTIMLSTSTFLQMFMKKCRPEQYKSLRMVIVGAEKMRPEIADKFRELSGMTVIEGYGCTELSPVVSINIANSILELGARSGPVGSAGTPMPGICVRIADPATREELPQGEEGLMLVKGPNVMQGYLGEPEKTADAIRDGWYNTGDIAKMDSEGRIWITGRLSRFSKIGGEMAPHELIEETIHKILGGEDRLVAVCGVADPKKGEKIVVLHLGLPMTPEQIAEEMRKREVANLWIPRPENFRKIDHMPLLASGKLDLAGLRKTAENLFGE